MSVCHSREPDSSSEGNTILQVYEDSMEDAGVTTLIPMSINLKSMRAQPETQHQLEKSMELIKDMKKQDKVVRLGVCLYICLFVYLFLYLL